MTVAELAAYLRGLVDAGMGECDVWVRNTDEGDLPAGRDAAQVKRTHFARNEGADPANPADELGVVWLLAGESSDDGD